jgi:hypothetical protein
MGDFVNKNTLDITVPDITAPNKIEGLGDWTSLVNPSSPWLLINERFDTTTAEAEKWATLLEDYLTELNDIISAFPVGTVDYTPITIGNDVAVSIGAPPELSTAIDTTFPDFEPTPYSLSTIPTVDTSSLLPQDLPDDITAAINWVEDNYDDTLFQILYAQLISDLSSGAGGLGGTIEQEIYDRAVARQNVDNDARYVEIEEYAASRGFELPTGAMMGRLQEQTNSIAANNLDINGKILIEQADLAQKNQQFVIRALNNLEGLLRDFSNRSNDRSLDYAKAVAANAIAIYAERMRAYLTAAEANKIYIEAQIDVLRSIIESNNGLVAQFLAEAQAFSAESGAVSDKNKAITDVFNAEMNGYDTETKAIAANQAMIIAAYELKIKNAEAELSSQIAELDASVKGYTAEYSLRERVAEGQANIAMQAMSSAYGAVNASAGLSYNGSESLSDSWNHGESRSDNYSHSESISKSASISKTISNALGESHSYEET